MISFDLFDTLLDRTVDDPNDIFDLITPKTTKYLDPSVINFKDYRLKSRNWVKTNSEEIPLDQRYAAIAEKSLINKDIINKLHQLELESELFVLKPKFLGRVLFDYALKKRKRVIIISDTFYDRDFIENLLNKNSFNGFHKLYLSSEENVLKRTGNLFKVVLANESISPSKMLHIGDDRISDFQRAKESRISSILIPKKSEIADIHTTVLKEFDKIHDKNTKSLIKGLCARKITQQILSSDRSKALNSANILGYTMLGPIFLAFSKWILEKAYSDKVTDVYFLARDGDIIKKCCDIINNNDSKLKFHYVLCSRRSTQVANICSKKDIIERLDLNFTPCSLANLALNRFGVSINGVSKEVFAKYGFENKNSLADSFKNISNIKSFFSDEELLKVILENSLIERENLIEYYKSKGLSNKNKNFAFVDIGHGGTLQKEICNLMDIESSIGYYFVTYDRINQNLDGIKHKSKGFLLDKIKANQSATYKDFLIMFELIFLNDHTSFIKFDKAKGKLNPIFLPIKNELKRIRFSKLIHEGAKEFVFDIQSHVNFFNLNLKLDANEAVAAYCNMIKYPELNDLKIFTGISFENVYSSRDHYMIVPDESKLMTEKGLWQHMSIFDGKKKYTPLTLKILYFIVKISLNNERKYRKFLKKPKDFFSESNHLLVKFLYKYYAKYSNNRKIDKT